MPKKTRISSGNPVNHDQADARIHRREGCIGVTSRSESYAQVNSRPLNEFVQKASLRQEEAYDYKTGMFVKRDMDILTNAQRQVNTLRIKTVTSGRQERQKDKEKKYPNRMYGSAPSTPRGW